MKRESFFLRSALLLLVISVFAFQSCKKSNSSVTNNNGTNNNGSNGSISAVIAGTNWKANFAFALDSANMVYLVGNMSNSTTDHYPMIAITFPDNVAVGTTIHFDVSQYTLLQYFENASTIYWAEPTLGGSGSLTVTKFNKSTKHIEGNFTADVKNFNGNGNSKSISSGSFSVNYY